MGASFISLQFDGKKNPSEISKAVRLQQELDRINNGFEDGYSGDWQTIPEVRFETDIVFDSLDEAEAFCEANSVKWSYAVAVKFLHFEEGSKKAEPEERWLVAGWAAE